ncbi:MAG TPA: 16S rRNA (guanine(527)-N(7))-methyltransferase RsmG [Spirochaetota bacterium]|nr:16S rRNA (guanine(527)-N(7))-methyltransferase RsmG [Spirochaetota bacterium]HPL18470.1 16S rRNA (guanine(527)-N(7))-methyltransferase RsmG [Spirochaetota bacterium]HQF07493.1 16S rRNA (guanine(527)-N(7))-methyltransferase RsmG [Spirochaetota bacterium]HQH96753.1 16S rRNA (guanine(527)-N(7))-methyltransferase RsmG [Spirochaetota bacterium]HQJ72698.1 16S rRNA (guanine(527)-N(7))-methyltransferase RsmG [Spirochaetota bacterium]
MPDKERIGLMNEIFRSSGFELTPRQLDQFGAYYDLLVDSNETLDLTRITAFEDIVVKHFIDSLYFTEFIELPSPIIDIGSGAGFPGIPLKIYLPRLKMILSEPRKKRAAFLEDTARALRLGDVEVYPHMVTERSFFTVEGVITRALESIDDTLTRVNHFLPLGGRVIFMKGPEADRDLDAVTAGNMNAYALETDRRYRLPNTSYERRLIVYRKELAGTRKTYSILKDLRATAGTAITSAENKTFKELKKLGDGGGIRKSGTVLVSGKKIIAELAASGRIPSRELILHDGYSENDEAINALISRHEDAGTLLVLKKALFNELDLFNTGGPLLAVQPPEMPEWKKDIIPGCTLLLPFQDPVNVGSVIRSAVGFNVGRIVILKEAANPYHPKSVRASAGAVFSAVMERGPSIRDLPSLPGGGASSVVALDAGGAPLDSFTFPERFLLLPGVEGPGLPEELKRESVSIPLSSGVESLNAPVAVSIALYEWSRQSPSNSTRVKTL